MTTDWHSLSVDETLLELNTGLSGITEEEARERLLKYGHNELKAKAKISPILIFLKQFLSPLIYVLLIAAIISIIVGHLLDSGVIMVAIFVGAIIGYFQETRAEKAMDSLIKMAAPKARVRRDGNAKLLPTREIVPGDILVIETGSKVPADARLLEVSNLKVNEAILTGESMAVEKHTETLDSSISIADRKNLAMMGTVATYGRAIAVAVRTGMSSEIGKIATIIGEVREEKTPLQKSIDKLSQYLVIIFLIASLFLLIVGLIERLDWLEIFLLAVAAAVSAIPEGLPAMVTTVLAIGMRVMAHRNAIIRRLVAVETLGSATVICSDKTGTLSLNEMTTKSFYVDNQFIEVTGEGYEPKGEFRLDGKLIDPETETSLALMLRIGALCNDALLTKKEECCNIFGDPTEGALVVSAAKAGMDKEELDKKFPRLGEIPFQSEKQYMATLHLHDGIGVAYVKGSAEKLLSMSKYVIKKDGVAPLDELELQTIMQANISMAKDAMRVIAIAYAELPGKKEELIEEDIKGNLTFVGLAGMIDPPREEAREAIKSCHQAGIKVVMITGDHKITAVSIARQLGLPDSKAITGVELQIISDEELAKQIEDIYVFARIEPLQKLRIVNAFKSLGHIVAMTGDGVNDAPALKTADIGIAMGITGTDVAKEASDMVLADDNFASIVAAVDEGRAIFERLRNILLFSISTSIGEILALILCIPLLGKAPLLAVQIIWINLVTGTIVAAPLGFEPKYGDELSKPPRDPNVGLIFPGLILRNLFLAVFLGVGIFIIFRWTEPRMSLDEARTIAFCAMATFEWFLALSSRSDEHSVFKLGFFRNRWLLIAIAIAIVLQLSVIYLPYLQKVFSTVPLSIDKWGIILAAGILLFIIEEIRKALLPRLFSLGKWKAIK
ncbi:cation-translocating P-type ATPase [Chloroflexota bacterium]